MNIPRHNQPGIQRELTVYFDGTEAMNKKARAYANSKGMAIKEFDVARGELNINELLNAVRHSDMTLSDVVDEQKFKKVFGSGLEDIEPEALISLIKTTPYVLQVPLLIKENKVILLKTASDILNH